MSIGPEACFVIEWPSTSGTFKKATSEGTQNIRSDRYDTLNGRLHLQDLYTNGEASTSLDAKNAELSPVTVKPITQARTWHITDRSIQEVKYIFDVTYFCGYKGNRETVWDNDTRTPMNMDSTSIVSSKDVAPHVSFQCQPLHFLLWCFTHTSDPLSSSLWTPLPSTVCAPALGLADRRMRSSLGEAAVLR